MALHEKMSSNGADPKGPHVDSSGTRLEADCHNSETTFTYGNNFDNIQDTSTTSTTTSETTKDILSYFVREELFHQRDFATLGKEIGESRNAVCNCPWPCDRCVQGHGIPVGLDGGGLQPDFDLDGVEKNGLSCGRINHLSGYDLDTHRGTKALAENIMAKKPRFTWVSLPCTRLSSLQNLTERDEEAWSRFMKRRGQDLRRAEEVSKALEPVLEADDFGWEWPIGAVAGWRSHAIQRLEKMAKRYGRTLYWVKIHGCQYGLKWKGLPLRKGWMILTTSGALSSSSQTMPWRSCSC